MYPDGEALRYGYDPTGERVVKWTAQGETADVNRYVTVRNGTLASKHVFVGSTRLSSTLVPGLAHLAPGSHSVGGSGNQAAQSALRNPHFNAKFGGAHPGLGRVNRSAQGAANAQDVHKNPHFVDGANPPPAEPPPGPGMPGTEQPEGNFRYYYHPDHLGSSSYITDGAGELYEHLQYFPFGETWVDQASNRWRTPYRFTGKELDEETGLYYFGARYYDPRTSVWQSVDPILEKYLPTGDKEQETKLAGMGAFNSKNINLFHYAGLNPVKLVDPDGKEVVLTFTNRLGESIGRVRTETGGKGQWVTVPTHVAEVSVRGQGGSYLVGSVDVTRRAHARSERGTLDSGTTPTLPINDVTFAGKSDSKGFLRLDKQGMVGWIGSGGPFIDSDGKRRYGIAYHRQGCSMGCSMSDYVNRSALGNLLNQAAMLDAQENGGTAGPALSDSVDYLNNGNFRVIHEEIPDYTHNLD